VSPETLRGVLLMTLGMASLALADVFIKILADHMPVAQILVATGLGGIVFFGLWARAQGQRLVSRDALHRAVVARNLCEMFGTICMITALALVPLATVSAILQATPLAVTLGAALFLGAQVGWRRWSAVGVGFLGVMLVLRPGLAGFAPETLFAVGAVVGLSGRDLATRAVPRHVSSARLTAWAFVAVTLSGGLLFAAGPGPAPVTALNGLYLFLALAFILGGVYAVTAAMRTGEIAVVTPFRYSRILFALVLAVLVFGERPDALTLAGAALIVASGLYTLWRESRAPLPSGPAAE